MEMTEKLQSKVVRIQQFSLSAHLQVLQYVKVEIKHKVMTGSLEVIQDLVCDKLNQHSATS